MTLAILDALRLKEVARKGWLRIGLAHPESVAAHSWGVALLAAMLTPEGLDRGRVLLIAVVHDLAEALVGDITPHDGVSLEDKRCLERDAMERFAATLPNGPALLRAWQEYEDGESAEGRFVKALDKLDMGLQALVYREAGDTSEFLASAMMGLGGEPALRGLLEGWSAMCVTRSDPGLP